MISFFKTQIKKVIPKDAKGLTLVESLIAISILVISVLGPLVIVAQALRTSFFARDQITAYYLAQEAIEYVRNVRDNNSLDESAVPNEWLYGITQNETLPQIAELDGSGLKLYQLLRTGAGYALSACPSNTCSKLNINSVSGVYGEDTGVNLRASKYTREVTFYKAPGDAGATQEITIEVVIKWNQVGGVYKYKLRENLTNWKIQNYTI